MGYGGQGCKIIWRIPPLSPPFPPLNSRCIPLIPFLLIVAPFLYLSINYRTSSYLTAAPALILIVPSLPYLSINHNTAPLLPHLNVKYCQRKNLFPAGSAASG